MKKSSLILLLFPMLFAGCTFNTTEGTNPDNQTEETQEDDDDELELYSIKITKKPTKTTYYVGEIFDPTGMVVEAHYEDKSTKVVDDYSFEDSPLTLGKKSIKITYKTKSAKVDIVVKEKPVEDLDEYTTTIDFSGSYFTSLFPEGTNFDNSDKFSQLCNYIDEQLDYYDLINEINCTKCTTREVDSDTFLQVGTGNPSKGNFNPGEFVWSCKEKIYFVEIVAFNYSNPYEDWQTHETVHNVDYLGHIKIDDVDGSLEIGSTEAPKTITLSKTYEEGANSFTLSSTGGRVLIKEMTITWRG